MFGQTLSFQIANETESNQIKLYLVKNQFLHKIHSRLIFLCPYLSYRCKENNILRQILRFKLADGTEFCLNKLYLVENPYLYKIQSRLIIFVENLPCRWEQSTMCEKVKDSRGRTGRVVFRNKLLL